MKSLEKRTAAGHIHTLGPDYVACARRERGCDFPTCKARLESVQGRGLIKHEAGSVLGIFAFLLHKFFSSWTKKTAKATHPPMICPVPEEYALYV